jgi:hypothetical protein
MTPRRATRMCRAGLAALALIAFPRAVSAANWTVPQICRELGTTGNEENDPPVVELYVNGTLSDDAVRSVGVTRSGSTRASIFVPTTPQAIYLVTVSYTPFLSAYWAPHFPHPGRLLSLTMPQAGFASDPRYKLFDKVIVTINGSDDRPMPGASVMWEPEFVGGSPYTTIANDQGQVEINCYQSRAGGNPVYVVSADGRVEFDTVINPPTRVQGALRRSTRGNVPVWSARNAPPQ